MSTNFSLHALHINYIYFFTTAPFQQTTKRPVQYLCCTLYYTKTTTAELEMYSDKPVSVTKWVGIPSVLNCIHTLTAVAKYATFTLTLKS